MIKGVTHAHLGPIWYHSEPSDVPYSPNQFLGWDFFAAFYSKTVLTNGSSTLQITLSGLWLVHYYQKGMMN